MLVLIVASVAPYSKLYAFCLLEEGAQTHAKQSEKNTLFYNKKSAQASA
jgi:hypothetical protein